MELSRTTRSKRINDETNNEETKMNEKQIEITKKGIEEVKESIRLRTKWLEEDKQSLISKERYLEYLRNDENE